MREFAKAFYESPAWRRTRAYILKRDAGLCVHCGEPGVIVHHKIELTPNFNPRAPCGARPALSPVIGWTK